MEKFADEEKVLLIYGKDDSILGKGETKIFVEMDMTDHFWFVCKRCLSVVKIILVKSFGNQIRFYYDCNTCGTNDMKKIDVGILNDNQILEGSIAKRLKDK